MILDELIQENTFFSIYYQNERSLQRHSVQKNDLKKTYIHNFIQKGVAKN
mgnify:CR=1 FL=1